MIKVALPIDRENNSSALAGKLITQTLKRGCPTDLSGLGFATSTLAFTCALRYAARDD